MSSSLVIQFPTMFDRRERPESPGLPLLREGLRLNASGVSYVDGVLGFHLFVTVCVTRDVLESFAALTRAIVLVAEDAAGGAAGATRLADPHVTFADTDDANFDPRRGKGSRKDQFNTAWVSTAVRIAVPPPDFDPSVFVTAVLQRHTSNTLAFNLRRASFESFLEGKPSAT